MINFKFCEILHRLKIFPEYKVLLCKTFPLIIITIDFTKLQWGKKLIFKTNNKDYIFH